MIEGGNRLEGEIQVSGAKNAAVAILPAALLTNGQCYVEKIPYIQDVIIIKDILSELGVKIDIKRDGTATIDSSGINSYTAVCDVAKKLRASYYILGALLSRYGKAEVVFPGGCEIGSRPIDQHIKGFKALGAKIDLDHGIIRVEANKLRGSEIYLDVVSVGATINIMLAAVKAEGVTTIVNAAKEPHVVDLVNFLNAMGANIKGAGTDTIRVKGVEELHGCSHTIIPDQIEAGTFMIASAATHGNVVIKDIIPKHLEAVSAKLIEMGMHIHEYEECIRVEGNGRPKSVNIKTLPYPGFPTDLQQPISVLLSTASGISIITETVWESRYKHIEEIRRMGARVTIEDRIAIIEGIERLSGTDLVASDLRAGAALIIAGLIAEGQTKISNLEYIDRGYEDFERKLNLLGANLKRINN